MRRLQPALLAEALGTLTLLAVVVGSGIMAERLAGGNMAIALLANAAATAAALYALIRLLAPISGAHFNPVVTLSFWRDGELRGAHALAYVAMQCVGGTAGVLLAHAMFELPLWQPGTQVRSGSGQWISEVVATAGLVLVIRIALRQRIDAIPALVAAWIFAAYWFTASTSFANPAVTLARALTRSFAGIAPVDVPAFVLAQIAGLLLALLIDRLLQGDAVHRSR
ncbi:MAG: aquaporin [Lysobacteraceae bacterium]